MSGPQASVDRVPEKLGADLVKAFLAEPVGSPFFGGPDHVGFLAGEEELRVPARGEVEDELPPRVLGCRQGFHDVHPLEVQGRGAPSPLPHGRIRRDRHLGAQVGNEKDSTLLVTLKQSGQTDRVRDVDDGGKASVVGAWRGGSTDDATVETGFELVQRRRDKEIGATYGASDPITQLRVKTAEIGKARVER